MSVSEQIGAAGGEEFERDSDDVAADVYDFVEDYLDDRSAGRLRPLHEYLARYPGAESEIAAEYLRLTGHTVDESELVDPSVVATEDAERRIGRYRLVRLLGRGGQGEVWLAEDERLGRDVAIKLLTALFVTEDRRARFRREAESIARLEHAGLAHVHEADIDGDVPYIAMRYVPGVDLGSSLAQARARAAAREPGIEPLLPWIPQTGADVARVLRFFERCARALHAAHEAGVLHRDVKPGNIMVTPEGEPVLLDFGLAREEVEDGRTALTRDGDVFGTLAYMSPEQLRGASSEVDARADVWALGVTLFEALTGQRPFEGSGPGELAVAIDSGRRKDSHALNAHLSTDVRVVLDTALERSRDRRYSTALALAEDLRRIREYEPIRARPAGPLLRLQRWCRREPAWAAALAVTLVALVGGLVYSENSRRRIQSALDKSMARHLSAEVPVFQAQTPAGALAVGLEAVGLADSWATRSVLFPPLLDLTLSKQFVMPERPVWDFGFIDETTVVACGTGGTVRSFDRLSGEQRATVNVGDDVRALVVDEARDRVLVGTADGRLVALHAETLEVVWQVELVDGMIHDLVLGGGGGAALVGGSSIVAFDPEDGARSARHEAEPGSLGALRLAASADRLVVTGRASHGLPATRSNAGLLLAFPSLDVVAELNHEAPLRDAAIAERAGVIATVDDSGKIRLFDLSSGEQVPVDGTAAGEVVVGTQGTSVAIDAEATCVTAGAVRSGSHFVVAIDLERSDGVYRAARRWETPTERRVVDLKLSPDEIVVACASWDNRVRVLELSSGQLRSEHAERNRPSHVAWSPTGGALVSIGIAGTVEVWRTKPSTTAFRLAPIEDVNSPPAALVWGSFTAGGDRIVALDAVGRAGVFEAPSRKGDPGIVPGALVGRIDPSPGSAAPTSAGSGVHVAVASGAPVAVWVGANGTARTVETVMVSVLEEVVFPIPPLAEGEPAVRSVAVSPDGSAVVVIDGAGQAWFWRPGNEPSRIARGRRDRMDGGFRVVVFGARGDAFLADEEGSVLRVSADDPSRTLSFEPLAIPAGATEARPGRALGIAVSPGGDEVVVASERDRLQCWNAETGERSRQPAGRVNRRWVHYLDGGRILSAAAGAGTACVIDADGVARQPVYHDDEITSCAPAGDGEVFLTGSLDGTVFVWDAATIEPRARAAVHAGPVFWVATAPGSDGARVLSCAVDGGAVWPVDVLGAARRAAPRGLFAFEQAVLDALVGED